MARTKKLPMGMKYRSDNRIEYRFTIDGTRYSVYGATKEECRDKELAKREEIKAGQIVKIPTVAEYFDEWIEYKRNNLIKPVKSSTLRGYQKLINRMNRQRVGRAQQRFGDFILSSLESNTIIQLQESLLKDGLSTRTTNDCISLLKRALNRATDFDKIIASNPVNSSVESVTRTEEQARDTIHRALNREEVDIFLQAARDSWYYPLYVFLLNTGLRIGEASALTVRDVTEQSINVCKTVTRTEIGYTIADQTKTKAGKRKLATRPEAWKAFQDQRRNNEIFNSRKVVNMNSPVFTLPKGGIIRPDRVNDDIKRICKLTGIEYFTCHAFRATFTSRCISANVPVKVLMETLGHKDVQMTLGLYGHAENQQKRDEILAVNM